MGQRLRELISVYVTPEVGTALRKVAALQKGSVSAYMSSLAEQSVAGESNDRERHTRLLEYIVLQNDKTLDHHNPEYKKQVLAQHQERYKKGQSNAD